MPRARNIKHEFFKNEDLAEVSPYARLLFIGLWTLADCKGRLEHRPKRIKAELFPYESLDIDAELADLEQSRFIQIYTVQGQSYIGVLNFEKHQNPHKNERDKGGICPDPIESNPEQSGATQVTDFKGVENNPDLSGQVPSQDGTDRADSLLLIPERGNLIPEGTLSESDDSDPKPKRNVVPFQKILDLYHNTLPELPRAEKLTKAREGKIRQRWLSDFPTLDDWKDYFAHIRNSEFLMGRSPPGFGRDKPFRADLDWLINESNAVKICEGKYHE